MAGERFTTIKAESLSSALEQAENLLQTSQDNIEYRVVSKTKEGFLFPKNFVTIKARRKISELDKLVNELLGEVAVSMEEIEPCVDGNVEITDGMVKICNPKNGGRYPTIIPHRYVKVLINSSVISEETVVTEEDQVTIEAISEEPDLFYDVEYTEDNMQAFLIQNLRFGKEIKLVDTPPSVNARVETEVIKEIIPPRVSLRQIMQLLGEKGIIFGLDEAAISQALANKKEGTHRFLVAQGHLPVPGRDSSVEYFFKDKGSQGIDVVNPYKGAVDYSVQIGEVLAIVTEPEPGQPGTDIFGCAVEVPPPQKIQIKAGEGVKLVDGGKVAVANMYGRPYLEKGILRILPVYLVRGNVDISVGNLAFKGDIIVYGDVLEGFKLSAGGNIIVYGNVIKSTFEAGGDITVHKSVISSYLDAGGIHLAYKRLSAELGQTAAMIEGLIKAMQMLQGHRLFKVNDLKQGEGLLVQLLIDNKFKSLPKQVEGIFEVTDNFRNDLDEEIYQKIRTLKIFTGINPLRIKSGTEINESLINARTVAEELEKLSEFRLPSNVTVNYTQNSVIKTSGDIKVIGRGCLTSDFSAGGSIHVDARNSVFRGGKLTAGKKISVSELGSNGDVLSKIRLEKDTVLLAELVHPAVVIESRFGKHRFEIMSRLVKAYITSEGKLEVEKLKN